MLDSTSYSLDDKQRERKIPIDLCILGCLVLIDGFFHMCFALILLSGMGYFPFSGNRPALFGTLNLTGEVLCGVYSLILGIIALISAIGVLKRIKYCWWLLLIYLTNNILDLIQQYSEHRVSVTIWICLNIFVIIWLIYRRNLYFKEKTIISS